MLSCTRSSLVSVALWNFSLDAASRREVVTTRAVSTLEAALLIERREMAEADAAHAQVVHGYAN